MILVMWILGMQTGCWAFADELRVLAHHFPPGELNRQLPYLHLGI